MNPTTSTEKQKEEKEQKTEENAAIIIIEEQKETTLFSYSLARCILEAHERGVNLKTWEILEKGSEVRFEPKYEISYDRIKDAASQIKKHVLETPCDKNSKASEGPEFEVYVKKEFLQLTESVKARGVIYTLQQLTEEQKRNGVIAMSTGNFASTLCYFGNKFKVPVTVVIPESSVFKTEEMIKQYEENPQIRVIVQGSNILEAHNIALDIAKKEGLCYIDGNNHPDMIVGQATLGIEIVEQMKSTKINIDAVMLPSAFNIVEVTAATAMAIKGSNPNIKVIAVQIPIFDSLMNTRTKSDFFRELDELDKHRKVPQSCYKDLSENLIDHSIYVEPDSVSLTDPSPDDYFEAYAGFGICQASIHWAYTRMLIKLLTRWKTPERSVVVIALRGKIDTDGILTHEPKPEISAGPSKLPK